MGRIIHKNQECWFCPSSDAVQLYEDGGAKCFSCGKAFNYQKEYERRNGKGSVPEFKEDNYQRKYKSYELEDYFDLPSRGWKERLVSKKTAEFFGVKVSYNEEGEIAHYYFPFSNKNLDPVVVGYKRRNAKQKDDMSTIGEAKTIFGLEHFKNGGKRIVITEGEMDTLAIAEASLQKWNSVYPVCSMGGAQQTSYLVKYREIFRNYDEVIIWFDNDEQGQKAAKEAAKIIGSDKVKVVKSNEKDANDVLIKYGLVEGSKKIWNYIYDAPKYTPAGIVAGEDTWAAYQSFQELEFVAWPEFLSTLNSLTFGRAFGTITMIAAGCHGAEDLVLMHDGSLKTAAEVVEGDLLLGYDGKPRKVSKLARGWGDMYRVVMPHDVNSFTCNGDHILRTIEKDREYYITARELYKNNYKKPIMEVGVPYDPPKKDFLIDPYVLGLWVGSSVTYDNTVILPESLIKAPLSKEAWSWLQDNFEKRRGIPKEYFLGSYTQRYELLRGIKDSQFGSNFGFKPVNQLAMFEVQRLVEGLTISTFIDSNGNLFFRQETTLTTSIREIVSIGHGEYFGWEIEGEDKLYQLKGGIVTHNTSVGKSTLLREDIYHLLQTTDYKIGACFLEEDIGETVEGIMGLHLNKRLGLPFTESSEEERKQAWVETVGLPGRILFLDHQGSVSDGSLIEKIEYLAIHGCRLIYLDHITIAVSETDGESVNTAIDKFMSDLLKIVKRHGCWLGVVSHLRKVKAGENSFETGAPISEDDLKGSGSLKQISFQTLAISRNKLAENEEVRHRSTIWLLKDRKTGNTGVAGAYKYNKITGRLEEVLVKEDDDFEVELIDV